MNQDEINRLLEISKVGDDLKTFKDSGFLILEKHILKPMEQGAFIAFQETPAEETARIIEAQMMGKLIRKIRKEIDSKIEEGKLAKNTLNQGD